MGIFPFFIPLSIFPLGDTIDDIKLINNENVEKLMNEFNNSIIEYAKRYYKLRKENKPIAMTKEN